MKIGIGFNKDFVPKYNNLSDDEMILVTDFGHIYCSSKNTPIDYVGKGDPKNDIGVKYYFNIDESIEVSTLSVCLNDRSRFNDLLRTLGNLKSFNLTDFSTVFQINRIAAKILIGELMKHRIIERKYNWLSKTVGWHQNLEALYTGPVEKDDDSLGTFNNIDEAIPRYKSFKKETTEQISKPNKNKSPKKINLLGKEVDDWRESEENTNMQMEEPLNEKIPNKKAPKRKVPQSIIDPPILDPDDVNIDQLEDPESLSYQLKKDFSKIKSPLRKNSS